MKKKWMSSSELIDERWLLRRQESEPFLDGDALTGVLVLWGEAGWMCRERRTAAGTHLKQIGICKKTPQFVIDDVH